MKTQEENLDCPFDFTSRCTLGRCDCKSKQETLEEAAQKRFPINHNLSILERMGLNSAANMGFIEGAKWQAERMYSDEDVLKFTQTIISQYKSGNTNIENIDLLTETLEKFKNSRKLSEKK